MSENSAAETLKSSIAIIGAGVAGLSTAHYLQKAGLEVTVFESEPQVGGRIKSITRNGYTMDLGAITLATAYTHTLGIIDELGASEKINAPPLVVGIARDNQVHEIDLKRAIVSAIGTRLLSLRAKVRLVGVLPTLLKYWRKCNFYSMGDLRELDTETCESFARRTVGHEAHDFLIDPAIRINMFNNSDVANVVDLIWAIKLFSSSSVLQMEGGMGGVAELIASSLHRPVQVNETVTSVTLAGDTVELCTDKSGKQHFDYAVVTTPQSVTRELCPWVEEPLKGWLSRVRPASSLTISIGLCRIPNSKAALIMCPTKVAPGLIGIALDHNKSPDRAPEGKALITLHMTADWARENTGDDISIAKNALNYIAPFFGDYSDAIDVVNLHYWDYVDYERYVGCYHALNDVLESLRKGRVMFAGEFLSAGIEASVISGQLCADAIRERESIGNVG